MCTLVVTCLLLRESICLRYVSTSTLLTSRNFSKKGQVFGPRCGFIIFSWLSMIKRRPAAHNRLNVLQTERWQLPARDQRTIPRQEPRLVQLRNHRRRLMHSLSALAQIALVCAPVSTALHPRPAPDGHRPKSTSYSALKLRRNNVRPVAGLAYDSAPVEARRAGPFHK